jgi:hypothetical protein
VLEIFVSTKNFPKEYKYSLGRDMEGDVLVLMRCIYRANRAQEKTTFLNEFLEYVNQAGGKKWNKTHLLY